MEEDDDISELDAPLPDDAESELASLVAAALDEIVALLDDTAALLEETVLELTPADEECTMLLAPALEDDEGEPLLELEDDPVPDGPHWPHASGPRNTSNIRPWEHFMRILPRHKGPVCTHTPNPGLTREETPGQGARP